MNALDGLRGYLSGILLTAVCLLWLSAGSVSAEEASGTASSSSTDSSGSGLTEALEQDWGSYKVQWGANRYQGKEATEKTTVSEKGTEEANTETETIELTREAPKSLRSGTSEESNASTGSSLRSLEGQLPTTDTEQAAELAE